MLVSSRPTTSNLLRRSWTNLILSAAILDSHGGDLQKAVAARHPRDYTGSNRIDGECAEGSTVQKPESAEVIVATLQRLLSSKSGAER